MADLSADLAGDPELPVVIAALSEGGHGTRLRDEVAGLVRLGQSVGAPCISAPTGAGAFVDTRNWLQTELGRVRAEFPGRVLLVLSDDRTLANPMRVPGCVPVLLDADRGSWQADEGVLRIENTMALAPLLLMHPPALLRLLRATGPEIQDAHAAVGSRFADARSRGGRLLVFGAGTIGQQVIRSLRERGLEPFALVDNDPTLHGGVVAGLTVLGPSDIDADRDVVVVAVGRSAAAIAAQLDDLGIQCLFNLSEMFYVLGGRLERDLARRLITERLEYLQLFLKLADEHSRRTLEAVVAHRLTFDTSHLANACVRNEPQWFDREILADKDDHVLVDGGAFDGDTIASFSERFFGHFRHAYGYEPDPALAARAADRFAVDPRVSIRAKGLSDHAGSASFATTGATDGYLSEAWPGAPGEFVQPAGESQRVELVRLDDEVREPISLLKLDVEGSELAAMRGASDQIAGSRPTLAIAVYHRASDLCDVPRFIVGRRAGDRLYLRHYTDVAFETVLYAVPEVSP